MTGRNAGGLRRADEPETRSTGADVVVGTVLRAHGIRGEVVIFDDSDNPERFAAGAKVRTDNAAFPELHITAARPAAKVGVILATAEVDTRNDAELLAGARLLIDRDERRSLADGEYWPDDLEGLDVRVSGAVVGTVAEVIFGPQIRLVVRLAEGGTAEIPFVEALVPDVDVVAGYLEVAAIEGLFTQR